MMPIVDLFDEEEKKKTGIVDLFDEEESAAPSPPIKGLMENASLEPVPSIENFRAANIRDLKPPESFGRPVLEIGMGALGTLAGTGSPVPGGAAIGGAGGFAIGKGLADTAYGQQPSKLDELAYKSLQDLGLGAFYETGGYAGAQALSGLAKGVGKVAKPALGWWTGTGKAAIDESLKGGKTFRDAMEGETSPELIVDTARQALSTLRNNRGQVYRERLKSLKGIDAEIDTTPVYEKMTELLEKYEVRITEDGVLDFSRSTLTGKPADEIQGAFNQIKEWGTQAGDKTPYMLDVLKRRLDNFYTESSIARGAVVELKKTVKGLIEREVPEYATMTKDYNEATKIIQDIESAYVMQKQGLSGRNTADTVLRRLNTAMKDNYVLRKELLDVMSEEGAQPVSEMVAGHAMSNWIPRGVAFGPPLALSGGAALAYLSSPKWLAILATASPRVAGETLNLLGKSFGKGVPQVAGKAAAYLTVPPAKKALQDEEEESSKLWNTMYRELGAYYR